MKTITVEITKLQRMEDKLHDLQIPFETINRTMMIIEPQTSPQYEVIPTTKELWINSTSVLFLDTSQPSGYLDRFLDMSIDVINDPIVLIDHRIPRPNFIGGIFEYSNLIFHLRDLLIKNTPCLFCFRDRFFILGNFLFFKFRI